MFEAFFEGKIPPLLTAEEEVKLATAAQDGNAEARDRLIRCNILLALKLAHRYGRKWRTLEEDLVGAAMIGLIAGVDGFDPGRGIKFATYATYHIVAKIEAWIEDHRSTIQVPRYLNWKGAEGKVKAEYFEDAQRARSFGRFEDALGAHVPAAAPAMVEQAETRGIVAEEIEKLADAEIIRRRFGMEGDPETLKQIGARMGITRERVRQREKVAMKVLTQRLAERGCEQGVRDAG